MGIGVGVLVLARKEFEKFNLWLAAVGKMKRQAGRQRRRETKEGGKAKRRSAFALRLRFASCLSYMFVSPSVVSCNGRKLKERPRPHSSGSICCGGDGRICYGKWRGF